MPPKVKPTIAVSVETHGVFDSAKVYTHHAIAQILGVADSHGQCSRYMLQHFLHGGLPFAKVGRIYLISGNVLRMWVEGNSKTWKEHFTEPSGDQAPEKSNAV